MEMTKNQNEQLDQNGKLECMLSSHNLRHAENAFQIFRVFLHRRGWIDWSYPLLNWDSWLEWHPHV